MYENSFKMYKMFFWGHPDLPRGTRTTNHNFTKILWETLNKDVDPVTYCTWWNQVEHPAQFSAGMKLKYKWSDSWGKDFIISTTDCHLTFQSGSIFHRPMNSQQIKSSPKCFFSVEFCSSLWKTSHYKSKIACECHFLLTSELHGLRGNWKTTIIDEKVERS